MTAFGMKPRRSILFGMDDYYVKSSSEKEDSRKVLTLEPYETHFGKSNVRQTLELEGSGLATRKVSWLFYPYLGKVVHDALWSGPIKEEQYIKIGKAIAVLAHGAMCYVMFCSFKELIKDNDYNTVGESVFKSFVKFFLSVFDMEDFERIFDQSVVEDEYSKLCEILDSCKCDPLVAIAEGKVKVDQFTMLREHDLCDTIWQHKCSAERKVKADQFSKLREHDIYDDRTQMQRKELKFKKKQVKHVKEVAKFEICRNNILQQELCCLRQDFVQFSHHLDVLDNCFSLWGEGSDDYKRCNPVEYVMISSHINIGAYY